jgi:hypothetical protein
MTFWWEFGGDTELGCIKQPDRQLYLSLNMPTMDESCV